MVRYRHVALVLSEKFVISLQRYIILLQCAFDENLCLNKYENVVQILKVFYKVRLEMYHKRKDYLEGILKAESAKLSNQARFILEKCDGTLVIENKKKKDMIAELVRRNYDSDPVVVWKLSQNREQVLVSSILLQNYHIAKKIIITYLNSSILLH